MSLIYYCIIFSINVSLPNFSVEYTPTESSPGGAILYIANYLSSNYVKIKIISTKVKNCIKYVFIETVYKSKIL